MNVEIEETIRTLLTPIIDGFDLEIFDIIVRSSRSGTQIEILIDKPTGGIKLEQCIKVNRQLNECFEETNFLAGDYTLEVNSPGLDRPLKNQRDFQRLTGRNITFYLSEKIENKLQHTGTILNSHNDKVRVDIKGEQVDIPYNKINKAVQEI